MMRFLTFLAQVDANNLKVPKTDLTPSTFKTILQIVFGIFGAVTVLIIVIAGLRFTISQGDPQATAKAKNTIIYALVGLVISMAAFSIVTFVIGKV